MEVQGRPGRLHRPDLSLDGGRQKTALPPVVGEADSADDAEDPITVPNCVIEPTERYEPRAPFGAYLLRIASNLCLSALRRRKVRAVVGEPEEGAPEPSDPNPVARPLYSSERDYLEQLDHYHAWQGK